MNKVRETWYATLFMYRLMGFLLANPTSYVLTMTWLRSALKDARAASRTPEAKHE